MGNEKCVGASHLNTFPYIFPITLPTSFPHTPTHFPTHPIHFPTPSPHIFPYLPHTPSHFPTSPPTPPISLPTAPLTSPYIPTHFLIHPMHSPTPLSPHLTHSFDYVAKLPSNSKSPMKFFTATGNLKSCFGVGNVNFRCMKVWRSYHVAKLLWRSYHVAKLLATSILYHTIP